MAVTVRTGSLAAILVLGALSSCGAKKVVTPPPAPAPVVLPPTPEPEEPPALPPAPKIDPNTSANPPAPATEAPPRLPAPPPSNRRPQRATTKPPAQPKPAETELSPAPQPAAPKLGQMLSADQLRDLQRKLDEALERVRGATAAIQAKALTSEQRDTLNRIRIFTAQAEQAREQDLVSAVSLAERADLLSRDLLNRLR